VSIEPLKTSSTAQRNRMIAIAAGVLTVGAIVLGFAGDFLGLPWHWMRPAAELLLLAELVGLVVLERHQLFEPVHGTVGAIDANVNALRSELQLLNQRLDSTGQVSFFASPSQTVGAISRAMQEALTREQEAPQILRWARLANYPRILTNPELGSGLQEILRGVMAFHVLPDSPPHAKSRLWTVRNILTFTDLENFDRWRESIQPLYFERTPLNSETKILVRIRSRPEGVLTPNLVTDRDVIVTLDDDRTNNRWGFLFQGRQYVAVFARWFDELWASISDDYLVESRGEVNQKAVSEIGKELEAATGAHNRPYIRKSEVSR
jgi:hypothetical protein